MKLSWEKSLTEMSPALPAKPMGLMLSAFRAPLAAVQKHMSPAVSGHSAAAANWSNNQGKRSLGRASTPWRRVLGTLCSAELPHCWVACEALLYALAPAGMRMQSLIAEAAAWLVPTSSVLAASARAMGDLAPAPTWLVVAPEHPQVALEAR